jgi:hypothetical protein
MNGPVHAQRSEARSSAVIADLNGDGQLEIAGGTTSGNTVEAMNRSRRFYLDIPHTPSAGSIMAFLSGGRRPHTGVAGQELSSCISLPEKYSASMAPTPTTLMTGLPSRLAGVEGVDWDVLWTCNIGGPEMTPRYLPGYRGCRQ